MTALKLAVFDLDFTVWKPEMYELHGPPKVKKVKSSVDGQESRMKVTDRIGTEITIFDGASYALSKINELREKEGMDIQAAVASRTDEPGWAQICMDSLTVHDGKTLTACFDHVEIGFNDKKWHFKRLKENTGIDYEEMVFFDNEMRNINSVGQLGVKCVYTPDGMNREHWHQALELFEMK